LEAFRALHQLWFEIHELNFKASVMCFAFSENKGLFASSSVG